MARAVAIGPEADQGRGNEGHVGTGAAGRPRIAGGMGALPRQLAVGRAPHGEAGSRGAGTLGMFSETQLAAMEEAGMPVMCSEMLPAVAVVGAGTLEMCSGMQLVVGVGAGM